MGIRRGYVVMDREGFTMSTRVPAYIFNADIYDADCVFEMFKDEAGYTEPYWYFTAAEPVLDALAKKRGIDRYDEGSFDSSDFPKVVFDNQLHDESPDYCGRCRELIE